MSDTTVLVADGARARFFELRGPEHTGTRGGPTLVEIASLVAPAHQARGGALYTEGVTGHNRDAGGAGHDYDEHREDHDAAVERRFAREVMAELQRRRSMRNVLCAPPQMLGYLRQAMDGVGEMDIEECPRDLSTLGARDIQSHLAGAGLLAERRFPSR
ncbi:host attachment protein [Spiribacter pallidus]|uniref:host attachment protein n=1 Tax=Spiribacter pallidus TaxID=1987936 RepID=UPI00349F92E8